MYSTVLLLIWCYQLSDLYYYKYTYCTVFTAVNMSRCLNDLSTHEPTMTHFDPHYPPTQWTVCCDTYTINLDIFGPPRIWGWLFDAWFLVTFEMFRWLWSKMRTFCHMIFMTNLWWHLWFLGTSVMTSWLLGKKLTFCHMIFFWHSSDQLPVKGTVSWDFSHVFWFCKLNRCFFHLIPFYFVFNYKSF